VSGGGWKEPFYDKAERDSGILSDLGNKVGWDYLEEEGKRNKENPGRAIGKAMGYALAGYLGGAYGGLYEGAGTAAAAPVIDESAGLAMNAAGTTSANLAEQQAVEQAMQQGLLSQTAAPVSDLSINTVPVNDLSTQAGLLDKGKYQLGKLASGSSTSKGGSSLATQMGMKMMMPQQQPQQAPMMRPQQGPQEPLHSPYGNPYGTSSGNSTGLPPMDEETRRKLRAMGYRV
jgi:hypothetical protein